MTEIRKESAKDIGAIFELNSVAFETSAEAKLVNALRESGNLFLSLVAEKEGRVVGHIAFSPMSLEGMDGLVGLAPMAVHPSLQRRGIGSLLVEKGLGLLKEMRQRAVFVLGHAEYYPRFGFRPAQSGFGIRSKYEVEDKYFMALELVEGALSSVSGAVLYCAEFDKIDS